MNAKRLKPLTLAVFCTAVLSVAIALDPDPRGHSTHTQLGLSECGFKTQFGVPCPACGMTTSVTHWFHGAPLDAVKTHPLGAFFALTVSMGFLWGWREAIWPRKDGWERTFAWVHTRWWQLVGAGVFALLANWVYTLWTHGAA